MTDKPTEPVLKSHRRAGVETTVVAVGAVRFGDGSYPVIVGPVAVEDEEQILDVAHVVAGAGGAILRIRNPSRRRVTLWIPWNG